MKKRMVSFLMCIILFATIIPVATRAESVFDKAVNMEELEVYSESLIAEDNNGDNFIYYKILIPEKGHIEFRYDECPQYTYGYLYDSNAKLVADYSANACFSNVSDTDPLLDEGTYYLKMVGKREDSHFKNLYYVFIPSKEPTVQFKITIKRGNTLDLSAVVEPKNEKVTWLSTKKTVATVSSTGTIKAIKAGTTKIYATLDNKTRAELTIVVKN